MKTEALLYQRAVVAAKFSVGCQRVHGSYLMAVPIVQPSLVLSFTRHPVVYLAPLIGAIALGYSLYSRIRRRGTAACLASSTFIFLMLASVMFGMYPYIWSQRLMERSV